MRCAIKVSTNLIFCSLFRSQFLLFMTHAVLAFSGDNFLTRRVPRANRVKLHWVLQACAATSISIAFACIYTYKVRKNSEHFTTSHGNLGSWTLLLCIGTVGGGILASNAASLRQIVKPVIIKIVHSSFGLISYSMAILTIFLGLNHPWTHERLSNAWINTLIAIVAVIWLCAVSRPVITVCGRIGGLARSS